MPQGQGRPRPGTDSVPPCPSRGKGAQGVGPRGPAAGQHRTWGFLIPVREAPHNPSRPTSSRSTGFQQSRVHPAPQFRPGLVSPSPLAGVGPSTPAISQEAVRTSSGSLLRTAPPPSLHTHIGVSPQAHFSTSSAACTSPPLCEPSVISRKFLHPHPITLLCRFSLKMCEIREPQIGLKPELAQSKCSMNFSVYYFLHSISGHQRR